MLFISLISSNSYIVYGWCFNIGDDHDAMGV
jgi:hypothetical protein